MAAALLASLASCASSPSLASEPAPEPRTLVLILDGVPFRMAERAVAEGAFAGWAAPARLVGPFPSMTNPSLTLLLSPLGVPPAPGYELQHYDWDANVLHGGGAFEHRAGAFPWRAHVQVPDTTLPAKFRAYVRPRAHFRRDLEWAERVVMGDERDVVVLHLGALDALHHVKGDEAVLPLLKSLDTWSRSLEERHERERSRPLRVVLLSDHGNSHAKIRRLFRGRQMLRRAGLRVKKRLERPRDVVVGTFGVSGYAALHVDDAHAEAAARALLAHPGVALAAWRESPGLLRVAGNDGDALVRWRDEPSGRRLGYQPAPGDPLVLREALARLRAAGLVDADGLASSEAWLAATADAAHPDAPERLVAGLTGGHVVHHATVLLSLEPGWAWGWKSAAAFAWFRGGALEGTHGGLDRESSVGFLLSTDASVVAGPVLRPETALVRVLGVSVGSGGRSPWDDAAIDDPSGP